jgi:MYXO-CTERM domain-containing protein
VIDLARHGLGSVVAAALVALAAPAQAALVTITGTNFDVTYDDALLGLYSAPTLSGDTLFFTINNFRAESLNGQGLRTAATGVSATSSSVSGLVLTAKNGFRFGAFDLAAFGDYLLVGTGSSVTAGGLLTVVNATGQSPALAAQTATARILLPTAPLTVNNGQPQNWVGTARVDGTTAPVLPGGLNVIASNPDAVGIVIGSQLTAFTSPIGVGAKQALIEEKFSGLQMTVTPVPVPAAGVVMALGLAALALLRRRPTASG